MIEKEIHRRVEVDNDTRTVTIPHWGITQRTIHGACVDAWPEHQPGEVREYKVVLKGKTIAMAIVRQHNDFN